MTPYPRPPSKHNRDVKTTFGVRIENMPMNVNRQEVISLFNTLIGESLRLGKRDWLNMMSS
ncbi:hypothetical protein ARMGADRAFT_1015087 [Armillaria gallica]|uniref:RRM domain-containing protein n=1 Tax=Armillaria gallica TaxID=47427 RepID=A0A2H3DET9_ARMGA|nr:hypothetical protein ARMGADRAFT_1015087 [Armillaria gallica]